MDVSSAIVEIRKFLANQISLEAIEDWSACYLQDAYRNGSTADKEIAHLLRSIINAYEEDTSQVGIREALRDAVAKLNIGPFTTIVYPDPSPITVRSAAAAVRLLDFQAA